MLQELFFPDDIRRITAHKPVVSQDDFWCWDHNKSGDYSVRSGYWLASKTSNPEILREATNLPSLNGLKAHIWSIHTVPKIKMFLWRASCDALPVANLILARGMDTDTRCQICGLEGESINHVFFTCSIARQVWALSNTPSPEQGFDDLSLHSNLHYLYKMGRSSQFRLR